MVRDSITIFLLLFLPLCIQAQELPPEHEELTEILSGAKSIDNLRSILILQNDEQIAHQFYDVATPDYPYNIKSVSKSIISLLVGIAIHQGHIPSVDEPISTYFPDYFKKYPNSKKASITIKNLLTMQAGLEGTSRENYGKWVLSNDWEEFVLDQPFAENPDEMIYSTGTSHLLSVIISKASGMTTRTFAETYLFNPLDIKIGDWMRSPAGYHLGGNNLAMKPECLLKIGQLVLNDGEYNGEQIIPKQWISESLKTYTSSPINSYDYGYMWWKRDLAGYPTHFAWGFGGQFIFVIKELESVVVVTSFVDNSDQERTYQEPIFDLMEKEIVPLLGKQYAAF